MTSEEFAEQKAYFKKLSKYYDKVHEDNDLRKLHECAKCENCTPKNYVPTDDESEDITEVGSVAKDTESEEDTESSSGSSGAEEGDRKTEQKDAVKDIMPTTDDNSGTDVDNDSDKSAEQQHVSSTWMAFKCSECAKIRKMQGALNCKQCSQCAKGRESENIMPENKTSSSEELDLENMLNETAEKDTEIEQNKQDETEQNVADKAVSLEEAGQKDIEESVSDDDKMDYLVDTDIGKEGNQSEKTVPDTAVSIEQNEKKNKENTHTFLVRPCSVNLKKLNIGKNKQYTVQEQMQDEVDIVDEQPKKRQHLKGKMFQTSERKFKILCQMMMIDMCAPKRDVPKIMAQSELYIVTCRTTIQAIKDFIVWRGMTMDQTASNHMDPNSFSTNIQKEFMVRDSLHTVGKHTLGHGNDMHIKKTAKIVKLGSKENENRQTFCLDAYFLLGTSPY